MELLALKLDLLSKVGVNAQKGSSDFPTNASGFCRIKSRSGNPKGDKNRVSKKIPAPPCSMQRSSQ